MLIVRVAGLPVDAVKPFSSQALLEELREQERLGEALGALRARLADHLHAILAEAPREQRGFFLSVRRDCFNGRPLAAHRGHPGWPSLTGSWGSLAAAILELEARLGAGEETLAALHRSELRREWRSLLGFLEDSSFLRGLSLASPELAENLNRLKVPPESFGRKERRLALTLLRYVSRTALKMSPFSTLTRIGVGVLDTGEEAKLEFPGAGRWREKTQARLHRELFAQCLSLLRSSAPFVEGLKVELNDTLECLPEGRYRFLRSGDWELDEESRTFTYRDEAFVQARLEGPLVERLLAELADGPQPYGLLLRRLGASLESLEEAEGALSDLLSLGFLGLVVPWDLNDPDFEGVLLRYLESLPGEPRLTAFISRLRQLLASLERFPTAASPLAAIEECRQDVEGFFRAALPLSKVTVPIEFTAPSANFKEDVFLGSLEGEGAVLRLPRDRAAAALESLDPLARMSDLVSSRHDFLLSLAALGHRHWPDREEVSFLEMYRVAQSLFKEYLRYRAALPTYSSLQAPGFDPLGVPRIQALVLHRRQVESRLGDCFRLDGDAYRLCPEALSDLLDPAPVPAETPREFCAFLQPLDDEGGAWVLNNLFEGQGRLGSRYTATMEEETAGRWVDFHLRSCFVEGPGGRFELLDISCPDRKSLNVHVSQTWRALKLPGSASSRLPAERLLRLKDLRVRLQGPEDVPLLADGSGQLLLPVHLGGLAPLFNPSIVKFLTFFGPGDLPPFSPGRSPHKEGDLGILRRHVMGNVVYVRKKWILDPATLKAQLSAASEARAFTAVNRWRMQKGIPDRVFAMGPVRAGSEDRKKPQYLDFSSPSFLQVLSAIVKTATRHITLTEALPDVEGIPSGWGAELQLESFAFRNDGLKSPVSCGGP